MHLLFDSHAHYDDARFDEDRDRVISSLRQNGVGWVIDAGCDVQSSEAAIALAERYGGFYAACGFHPNNTDGISDEDAAIGWLREILKHPKAVALGEIGLDYHYPDTDKATQRRWLELQLSLAEELELPVVIHARDAHGDIMDAVRAHPAVRGVFHCFSGSPEMAKELIRRGWYISVSGVVTYKNAEKLPEVAALVPDDRLLIETDSPYLTPAPNRRERNDSVHMRLTAERVAAIRGISYERVCEMTAQNAAGLFGIKL